MWRSEIGPGANFSSRPENSRNREQKSGTKNMTSNFATTATTSNMTQDNSHNINTNNDDNDNKNLSHSQSFPDLAGHSSLISPAKHVTTDFPPPQQQNKGNGEISTASDKNLSGTASKETTDQQEHHEHQEDLEHEQPENEKPAHHQLDKEFDLRPYVYKSCNDIVRKHGYKHGAISFIVRRFLRVLFTQSLPIYFPIHCLPIVLFKRKLLLENPRSVLLALLKANVKSCMFLSSFQTLFIAIVCLGNYVLRCDSPIVAITSGLIAPISILFENENRRKEMMLYCVPRVGEILEKFGVESEWFSKDRWDSMVIVLFSLSMGVLMHYYHSDATGRTIKPSIRSLISLTLGY